MKPFSEIKDKRKPILLLVDGHSLAFRSFYAYSKGGEGGLATKDGIPTSVTYGFLKALLEICKNLGPQGVAIAFDTAEPTFRHKTDVNYKANRDVAPEIFFQDLSKLQEILENDLDLSLFTASGFEADDVLGTIANKASRDGWSVRILSGDRDLFQLVNDELDISVMYMGGGPYSKSSGPSLMNEAGVKSKLGVHPKRVVDFKALTGDSSDNIPGVKGVGPKTAINLLKENKDLDGIYKSLSELEKEGEKASRGVLKGALISKLRLGKENAYASQFLAQIINDVPLEGRLRLVFGAIDPKRLTDSLDQLELKSLVKEVPNFIASFSEGGFHLNKKDSQSIDVKEGSKKKVSIQKDPLITLQDLPELQPQIITRISELKSLVLKLMQFTDTREPVAFDTETTHLNPFKAELVGLGVCWGKGLDQMAYLPIGHNLQGDLLEKESYNQISLEVVLQEIIPWLSSSKHPKVLQNGKYDRLILLRHGIEIEGIVMDTLLADYLRDANSKHSLDQMAKRELGFIPIQFGELVDKGKTFADVSIHKASLYCGMDVFLTRTIGLILRNKLEGMGGKMIDLLEKVEQPLERVLASMEATGVRIDSPYLKQLSIEITKTLSELEEKSKKLAGVDFNLASPKQLGELLFDKLGLDRKKSRRTKTGWSTDANVLEKLQSDHSLVPLLIEYRVLSKLLSTYVDALPQLVEPETGRIHTNFNQAVTATGRLSSSNPNLQNIPIRTEFSRRIRKAFLPEVNWELLSADYSQIELRILAHLSGEEVLLEAYQKGEDVHALTAKILLEKKSVSEDERRLGKTINFGVVYGMGAQRFARSTGVSQVEAKEFLAKYKSRYPKVFSYLELQERLALTRGYVETILGRRRYFYFDKNGLGRLLGKDPMEIDLDIARRGGLEAQQLRAAANAPIQGSSADIIKLAMVSLDKLLKKELAPARLLLQVHDELVIEVERSAVDKVEKSVVDIMEHAVTLKVPLLVETGVGPNWMEAK